MSAHRIIIGFIAQLPYLAITAILVQPSLVVSSYPLHPAVHCPIVRGKPRSTAVSTSCDNLGPLSSSELVADLLARLLPYNKYTVLLVLSLAPVLPFSLSYHGR
ncbi:hypothetical protein ACQKWADRAFT_305693 [Trichoderma austrokoningii]